MKRYADSAEARDEDAGPLFANSQASERGHARAELAASNAARLEPGWRSAALQAVREHAERNERFLAEHVKRLVSIPDGADARALGAVMKEAERLGYLRPDGYGIDGFGSPKTVWKSLVYARRRA